MYAPKVGWVQRDTLGHAAGVNLYAYCFGAPLVSVDPSGRIAITLAGGVVIVLIIAVGFVAIYELFKPGTPLQESCSACIDQTLQAGSTGIKNLLEAIVAAGCAILFQCALHLTDENNCIYYCPDLDEYFEMDPITGECPEIIEWYSNDPPWRGM